MAVCCQNLTLGALSRSILSVLVGVPFKMFGLFFEHALYVPTEFLSTCWLLYFGFSPP
jgi:hypothetical protein